MAQEAPAKELKDLKDLKGPPKGWWTQWTLPHCKPENHSIFGRFFPPHFSAPPGISGKIPLLVAAPPRYAFVLNCRLRERWSRPRQMPVKPSSTAVLKRRTLHWKLPIFFTGPKNTLTASERR